MAMPTSETITALDFPADAMFFKRRIPASDPRAMAWIVTRPDHNPRGSQMCWEQNGYQAWVVFCRQTEEMYCRRSPEYEPVSREIALQLLGLDPATRLPEGF